MAERVGVETLGLHESVGNGRKRREQSRGLLFFDQSESGGRVEDGHRTVGTETPQRGEQRLAAPDVEHGQRSEQSITFSNTQSISSVFALAHHGFVGEDTTLRQGGGTGRVEDGRRVARGNPRRGVLDRLFGHIPSGGVPQG